MTLPFSFLQRSTRCQWGLQLNLTVTRTTCVKARTPSSTAPDRLSIRHPSRCASARSRSFPSRSTVAECVADWPDCIDYLTGLGPAHYYGRRRRRTPSRPGRQRVTDSRRYAQLVRRTAYWGHQMLLYGVHVLRRRRTARRSCRSGCAPQPTWATCRLDLRVFSVLGRRDTGYAQPRNGLPAAPHRRYPCQFDVGGPAT